MSEWLAMRAAGALLGVIFSGFGVGFIILGIYFFKEGI